MNFKFNFNAPSCKYIVLTLASLGGESDKFPELQHKFNSDDLQHQHDVLSC